MATVLVTGCDTGIGREFATQYADAGYEVIATYRDLGNRLPDQPRIRHHQLDVTNFEHFSALKQAVGNEAIDILVSNAGVGRDVLKLGSVNFDYVREMLMVNTVGPLKLVETFVDNVARSTERRIAIVSSRMGSITLNVSGGHYGYRGSKAALNAIGRSLAIDLFPRGITVVMLHPGWVRTLGGDAKAPISLEDSVQSMRTVVRNMGNHESGQFHSFNGAPLAW